MRNVLFWAITQRVAVISYRCFGASYRSHLQRSRKQNNWILPSKAYRVCHSSPQRLWFKKRH